MALPPGSRIGSYTITGALGAGGMGEVYRARDAKLQRDVALKVLPESFAADEERVARFRREAQTLAALNHPHIAHVHGLEEGPGGALALVMELVEGDDLSARLTHGALPLEEAVAIARQIVDALAAAHEAGIVHRDLKPANIKVRVDGTAKVLDFGLAKAVDGLAGEGGPGAHAHSPTITTPAMTMRGVILGTAAYMAPEQAKGYAVDRRADIWAFGAVLFEMLSGRRAFAGDDVGETLASVIKGTVDWAALPAATPPRIHRLLEGCLARDKHTRIADIAVARFVLGEVDTPIDATPRWRGVSLAVAATAVLAAAALGAIGTWATRAAAVPAAPRIRADGPVIRAAYTGAPLYLSPDGQRLVYREVAGDGTASFRMRDLASGTERSFVSGVMPFGQVAWSPSGRRLLMSSAQARYVVVDTETLAVRELSLPWQLMGLTWIDEADAIVAAREGLFRVQVDAGAHSPLPTAAGELRSRPSMLPDGRRYLYLRGQDRVRDLCVGAVDDASSRCLGTTTRFTYGRGRVVLFVDWDGRLFGQTFDHDAAALTGTRVLLAPAIDINNDNDPGFVNTATVSRDGVVAFTPEPPSPQSDLSWFDRGGRQIGETAGAGPGLNFDVSPDGRLAAVTAPSGPERGVYTLDLARGVRTKVTDERALDVLLSPDGRSIAYVSNRTLNVQSISGGPVRAVYAPEVPRTLTIEDWSTDGRSIVGQVVFGVDREIVEIPIDGGSGAKLLARGTEASDEAQLSPDRRWLAYSARLSGRSEVFVTGVPSSGARVQVSVAGGVSPRWRDDGRELYFLGPDGGLHVVAMGAVGHEPQPSRPTVLFQTPLRSPAANLDHFAPGPGGKTFLIRQPVVPSDVRTVLLVNWF